MQKIQTTMDLLLSGDSTDTTTRGALLGELHAGLKAFGKDMLEHLDHEEHAYATPIARKVGKGLDLARNVLIRLRSLHDGLRS